MSEAMAKRVISEYIEYLETTQNLDKGCKTCQEVFYPRLLKGERLSDIFAPRHQPSARCRSGKHPHCTCDSCF